MRCTWYFLPLPPRVYGRVARYPGVRRSAGNTLMASPFPGYDPNLQSSGLWPVFHHQLIASLQQTLERQLSTRYFARVVQRQYSAEGAANVPLRYREDYLEVCERPDG